MAEHKISSADYDKLVQTRNEKRLAQMKKEKACVGFVIGSYFDVKGLLEPNVQVRCSRCQYPLFCTPHSRKIAEENGFPIVCLECAIEINGPLVRGTLLQEHVAISQLEKKMSEGKP